MHKHWPALIASVLSLSVSAAYPEGGTDYYPLHVGSRWVYAVTPREGSELSPETTTKTVEGGDASDGVRYTRVKNETGDGGVTYIWLRQDAKGDIALASLGATPDRSKTIMDFDPPITMIPRDISGKGASWETKLPVDESAFIISKCTVESDTETVRVKAGTFRNCLKVKVVSLDELGRETDVSYSWYAKGVGEVLNEQVKPESKSYRSELTGYSIQ